MTYVHIPRVETCMFLMGIKSQRFGASSFSKFYYTLQKKPFATPRTVLDQEKNALKIGRNSARLFYHTDLSRFVPSVSIECLTICWICPDSRISRNGFKTKKLRKRANLAEKNRCSIKQPWASQIFFGMRINFATTFLDSHF